MTYRQELRQCSGFMLNGEPCPVGDGCEVIDLHDDDEVGDFGQGDTMIWESHGHPDVHGTAQERANPDIPLVVA